MTTTRSAGQPRARARSRRRVLTLGALGVLEHLAQRALANVEVGEAPEVIGGHLQMLFGVHATRLLWLERAISVSSGTSSALKAGRLADRDPAHRRPGPGRSGPTRASRPLSPHA